MNRLEQLDKQIARLKRRAGVLNDISHKYWIARIAIFVSGVVLALVFCSFAGSRTAWFLAALIAIAFFIVTVFHTRVRESLTRNSLLINIKQVQMARIRLDWDHIPPADLSTSSIIGHPFETDLDITGERSLHRLLDCAVTKEGSERLKSWLLSVRPDGQLIKHRQTLVQQLKSRLLFRDKLQLLSAVARLNTAGPGQPRTTNWNSRMLIDWIERSRPGK